MIGGLLKQLFPALGRFLWHRTMRLFGRADVPVAPAPATQRRIEDAGVDVGLAPDYLQPIDWPCHRTSPPPEEVTSNALFQLWNTIPGGLKWTHYFPVYEAIFGPRRAEALRIMEIGVHQGASLKLWRRYFTHPGTRIVGIDIVPECARFEAPEQGVHVRIGSQADGAFLKRVVQEFGPFDLIIDDGSHRSSHLIASFNHLFAGGLADFGIYFAEDLHANCWSDWRDSRRSFLELSMELAEYMYAHYRSTPPEAFVINQPSDQPLAAIKVPRITTMIQEIRLFDSMVAIYKTHRQHVPYLVCTAGQGTSQ